MSESLYERCAQLRAEAMAELRVESPELFRIMEMADSEKGVEPAAVPAVRAATTVITNRVRRFIMPDLNTAQFEVVEDGIVVQDGFSSIGLAQAWAENRNAEFGGTVKFRVRRSTSKTND